MIVRTDFDYLKLGGPRPYRFPVFLPLVGGIDEADPTVLRKSLYITFAPEYDTKVDFPDVYVKIWDVPWRWYCLDCFSASGDRNRIFKTDWTKREGLGGKGNRDSGGFSDPTPEQQQQMYDHAKQHSIMWSWAKGLK